GLKNERERAQALSEIAEAQRLVEATDAAKATARRLVDEAAKFKDPWARVSALREAAVSSAKLNERKTAQTLFAKAMEAQQAVDATNKIGALQQIAVAQASVGFIDDARKTASRIAHNENDFTIDGYRERALCAIAVAQVDAGDDKSAVGT